MSDQEEALSRQLTDLRPDAQLVRAYGEEHPDEFAALKMNHSPPKCIEVLLSGARYNEQEAALHRLIPIPDRLKVLPSRWSLADLQAVISDIREMAQAE